VVEVDPGGERPPCWARLLVRQRAEKDLRVLLTWVREPGNQPLPWERIWHRETGGRRTGGQVPCQFRGPHGQLHGLGVRVELVQESRGAVGIQGGLADVGQDARLTLGDPAVEQRGRERKVRTGKSSGPSTVLRTSEWLVANGERKEKRRMGNRDW